MYEILYKHYLISLGGVDPEAWGEFVFETFIMDRKPNRFIFISLKGYKYIKTQTDKLRLSLLE